MFTYTLCEKCPYLEFYWSFFFRFWTEYGEIRNISPYSVRMWDNTDQKNSKYEHFSRIDLSISRIDTLKYAGMLN